MDGRRFDDLARVLATPGISRRHVVRALLGGAAGGFVPRLGAGLGLGKTAAQTDPTPCPSRPKITSGPRVTEVTAATASVSWTTDQPSTSLVEFGQAERYDVSRSSRDRCTNHKLVLSALSLGTTYEYRVRSENACGSAATEKVRSFTTEGAVTQASHADEVEAPTFERADETAKRALIERAGKDRDYGRLLQELEARDYVSDGTAYVYVVRQDGGVVQTAALTPYHSCRDPKGTAHLVFGREPSGATQAHAVLYEGASASAVLAVGTDGRVASAEGQAASDPREPTPIDSLFCSLCLELCDTTIELNCMSLGAVSCTSLSLLSGKIMDVKTCIDLVTMACTGSFEAIKERCPYGDSLKLCRAQGFCFPRCGGERGGTKCNGRCVDIRTDPDNCGGCGEKNSFTICPPGKRLCRFDQGVPSGPNEDWGCQPCENAGLIECRGSCVKGCAADRVLDRETCRCVDAEPPEPTETPVPLVAPTSTPVPLIAPTNTPEPEATVTPVPLPTDTPRLLPTETPAPPPPTATPGPPPTATPVGVSPPDACTGVACGGRCLDCGGVCVDVVYDPNNCGGCGIVCESGSCPGGACAPVDACGGLTNCGGVCVDTTSDRYNCGGCGNFCEYGCNPGDDLGTCVNGACGYGC